MAVLAGAPGESDASVLQQDVPVRGRDVDPPVLDEITVVGGVQAN